MTIVLDPFDSAPDQGAGSRAYEDPFTAGLNPQQKEAVEYRGESLLIVAGAGSGKTSVL
ncbi:UvrD-helicase domain-containing protein, partial [Mycobacteroides abscessus]